ncbi:MAG TPA: sigma-54 dependent transcriptional regulator [Desulfoprunum sp.]|nr:sigma-54 dependent transcriptional regulator [Desulfoprunum sp.]
MNTILIYDASPQTAAATAAALEGRCVLRCTLDSAEFQEEINERQYDLVFLDIDAAEGQSMELLEKVHGRNPLLPIIITSKSEKVELIVKAINAGACDFLVHPLSKERITLSVDRAIEIRDQRNEIDYLRRKQDIVYNLNDVIAESPEMKEILKSLERFAKTDSTILITGDTGTGKSFLSGTVHFNSPRRKKPFVKINCANIPVDLLESELFGHEKGAFTGADKLRIGRFEQASGGTIFLDEIGEMSMGLQTKLLRVLEEKSFERVGGNRTIHADVRIIAATNKNLPQQVEKGLFREDLYYRINVLPVRLPSLKERRQCLEPLARTLLQKCGISLRRSVKGFTDEAMAQIIAYDWPGNIRQLANTIERAVILEDGGLIHADNLALPVARGGAVSPSSPGVPDAPGKAAGTTNSLANQERDLILKTLEECLWVQKNAAGKLGISPRALNYKINKLGITHPHWRRNATPDSREQR